MNDEHESQEFTEAQLTEARQMVLGFALAFAVDTVERGERVEATNLRRVDKLENAAGVDWKVEVVYDAEGDLVSITGEPALEPTEGFPPFLAQLFRSGHLKMVGQPQAGMADFNFLLPVAWLRAAARTDVPF